MKELLQSVLTDAAMRNAADLPAIAASSSSTFEPWDSFSGNDVV